MTDWDSRILRHWAAELEVDPAAFAGNAFTLRLQQDRQDRVIVYTSGDARVILVPRRYEALLSAPPAAATVETLSAWLGVPLQPRWADLIAYATSTAPEPDLSAPARWLSGADAAALDQLKAACTADELALAQITIADPLIVGCFAGDALVGVASTLDVSPDIADIGVLTHPGWRGRGLAAGLTTVLRNRVVAQGRVAQYMTMYSNRGSLRTAEKAGFTVFLREEGFTLGVAADGA